MAFNMSSQLVANQLLFQALLYCHSAFQLLVSDAKLSTGICMACRELHALKFSPAMWNFGLHCWGAKPRKN